MVCCNIYKKKKKHYVYSTYKDNARTVTDVTRKTAYILMWQRHRAYDDPRCHPHHHLQSEGKTLNILRFSHTKTGKDICADKGKHTCIHMFMYIYIIAHIWKVWQRCSCCRTPSRDTCNHIWVVNYCCVYLGYRQHSTTYLSVLWIHT